VNGTDEADFASLLRRYRRAASLTQGQLAERAQMSTRAISDLERGVSKEPYRSTVEALAEALELDSDGVAAPKRAARRPTARSGVAACIGGTLPIETTPLLGREDDQRTVLQLLDRPLIRLVTLTGAGGVGKTRLALGAAREAQP
jgi:transcriptional regulator with XRE-family HTH domain